VLGESATGSGQILIPLLLAMMVGSAGGARLVLKVGFRVIVTVGAVSVSVGTFLLTRLTADSGAVPLGIFLVVIGFGMGLIFRSTTLAAQYSVALPRMGVATGLVNFMRQRGGAIGVAVAASVMLTSLTSRLTEAFGAGAIDTNRVLSPTSQQEIPPAAANTVADAFAGALHEVFWVAFVIALIGLVATVLMPRGAAAKLRDAAREESKVDSLSPDGETYELTSTIA
jgi:MFS family permease